MGKRQDFLKKISIKRFGEGKHPKPSKNEILNSRFFREIKDVYLNLNGQYLNPPTRFGPWDIDLYNFIIELDEERHFNRYRKLTLESDIYFNWKYFDIGKYKSFCIKYEQKCLNTAGWAGNWKNNSTEKQFGESNIEKNLEGNGSSRWKQRAYYDFVKDICSQIINVPIIRISIYEKVDFYTIDELLNTQNERKLLKYIEKRLENIS